MRIRISADASRAISQIRRYQISRIQEVKDAVNQTGLAVTRKAKQRAPVDTGRLRASIQIQIYPNGLTADVGTNVEYAPYVEFGTSKMRAQPFLFPSWFEERPAFEARIRSILRGAP